MWVKATGSLGRYINLNQVAYLETNGVTPTFGVTCSAGSLDIGPFATRAEAEEAIRQLVSGVDSDTLL